MYLSKECPSMMWICIIQPAERQLVPDQLEMFTMWTPRCREQDKVDTIIRTYKRFEAVFIWQWNSVYITGFLGAKKDEHLSQSTDIKYTTKFRLNFNYMSISNFRVLSLVFLLRRYLHSFPDNQQNSMAFPDFRNSPDFYVSGNPESMLTIQTVRDCTR